MALFPTSPIDGQTTVVNGILYTYSSSKTAWVRTALSTLATTVNINGTVTANVFSASGNITGGNINTSGQLVSTVATGTAPLVVNSTTQVSNLYSSRAGLADNVTVNVSDGFLATVSAASGNIPVRSSNRFTANNTTGVLAGPTFSGNLTGTTSSVSGNANVGNLGATGLITATGNITGGNITTVGTANVATLEVTTLANVKSTTAATSPTTGSLKTAGGLGVSGNAHIGGALVATTKSFAIQHPDKKEIILYHGCLEGPEHAIYTRGRCNNETIVLPDYWKNLVDTESITVHLTPIGECEQVKVKNIMSNIVTIQGAPVVDCFYIIHARRKDVPPLTLEVPGLVEDLYRDRNL